MATEDVRIEGGHVKVDRVEGKQGVDVALSDVESVSYTRGAPGGTGALVLHTKDGDHLIRVESEDAGDVLKKLSKVNKPEKEESTEDEVSQAELAPAPKGGKPASNKTAPTEE
jgi:hypothetical protein